MEPDQNETARIGVLNLVGTAFRRITQFGTFILIGRSLGSASYGLFAIGFSVLQLGAQLGMIGLQHGVVRFIPHYSSKHDSSRIKGIIITAYVIVSVLTISLSFLLAISSEVLAHHVFGEPQLKGILFAFSGLLFFYVFVELSAHMHRALSNVPLYIVLRNLAWPLMTISVTGAVLCAGLELRSVLIGIMGATAVVSSFGLITVLRRTPNVIKNAKPLYEIKPLLRFALPSTLIGFSGLLLIVTDRMIIAALLNAHQVGIYDAASRIANQLAFVLIAFNMASAPFISYLHAQGELRRLQVHFQQITRLAVIFTLPLAMLMILFPHTILTLFGGDFAHGSDILRVLTVAGLVNAAVGPAGLLLIMSGKQDLELVNIGSIAIVNAVSSLFLTVHLGIIGAAIATTLSISLLNIVRLVEVYWLYGAQPFTRSWLKPILSCFLCAIVGLILGTYIADVLSLLLLMATLAIAYFALLLIMKPDHADLLMLKSLVDR